MQTKRKIFLEEPWYLFKKTKFIELSFCPEGSYVQKILNNKKTRINFERGFWMMSTLVTDWMVYFLDEGVNIKLNGIDTKVTIRNPNWYLKIPKPLKGFENYPFKFDMLQDILNFCARLTNYARNTDQIKMNEYFDLPNQAEWVYASYAGTDAEENKWFFGNDITLLNDYCWSKENSDGQTFKPVRLKKPNPWGFYDMYGNIEERCYYKYLFVDFTKEVNQNFYGSLLDKTLASEYIGVQNGCVNTDESQCFALNQGIDENINSWGFDYGTRLVLRSEW